MKDLKLRPFDETIVDALADATVQQMQCLADLIKNTKISRNHDKILAAWNTRARLLSVTGRVEDYGVTSYLLQQIGTIKGHKTARG